MKLIGLMTFHLCALTAPACAAACWCQLAPSPDAAPVSTALGPLLDEKPVATLKQDVNLVDLFFTVKDRHGRLIPHLSEHDCSVLDEDLPQTLKSFIPETNQPLTLGILLDTSVSQIPWLRMEQDAGSEFIRQVLRSKDQAFLGSFDVNIDLLQDYTNSPDLLTHALNKAQINGGGSAVTMTDPGPVPVGKTKIDRKPKVDPGPVPIRDPRGTLLYDAISLAANEKMNQEAGRKAMIVLTDGDDQGSNMSSQDAVAAAEKNNIPVYVVWVGPPACLMGGGKSGPGQPAPPPQRLVGDWQAECDRFHYFMTPCPGYYVAECIAEHSGGRIIVAKNSQQLEQAFQQIQDELRSQYLASYRPSNIKADSSFHKIAIHCHGDGGQELKVQVRKGYYAPSAVK
jgi:VWFA-related protein